MKRALLISTEQQRKTEHGCSTNIHRPLWKKVFEDEYVRKHSRPSGKQRHEPFHWPELNAFRFKFFEVPLEVAMAVSPGAAICFGVLTDHFSRKGGSQPFSMSRKEIARELRLGLEIFSTSRKEIAEIARELRLGLKIPEDRVTAYVRELKGAGFIDVSGQVGDKRGEQLPNAFRFLPRRAVLRAAN